MHRLAPLLLVGSLVACGDTASDWTTNDDNAQTSSPWKEPVFVGAAPGFDIVNMERSSLALDSKGAPHIAWAGNGGGLHVSRMDDRGVLVDEAVGDAGGLHAAITVDAQGREHVVHFQNGPVRLKYAVRDSSGRWTREDAPFPTGTRLSVAVDAGQTVHVSYQDYVKNEVGYLSRSPSGTWSAPSVIGHGYDPVMAVMPNGEVHVLFESTLQGPLRDAHRAAGAAAWTVDSVDFGAEVGPPAVAVDAAGTMHVAAARLDASFTMAYATRTASGAWSPVETAGSPGSIGNYYTSIAVDPTGLVRVVSSGNQQSILLEYTKAAGAWTTAYPGHRGNLPSLAIDARGVSHLTFRHLGFSYTSRPR